MTVDRGSLFCFSLLSLSFLSCPSFWRTKKKKCWMIYLCLSCTFGHLSSISGVWKTCFVVIAISLQCNLPCDWMLWFILFKLDIYLVSQTLFKTPKRMLPFVVASNYREAPTPNHFFFFSFQQSLSLVYSFCFTPLCSCREHLQYTS